jgi:hypothetical protein
LRRIVLGVLVLSVIGAVTWKWGSGAWRQGRLLYLQSRCANYIAPPDQIVFQESPPNTPPDTAQSRVPEVWNAYRGFFTLNLVQELPRSAARKEPNVDPESLIFLHERTSPSGNRRLLCVMLSVETRPQGREQGIYYHFHPIVINPATWTTIPQRMGKGFIRVVSAGVSTQPAHVRVYAGQVDPNPSRFNFRVNAWGVDSIIDVQLENDDSILVVPRGRLHAPTTMQEKRDEK